MLFGGLEGSSLEFALAPQAAGLTHSARFGSLLALLRLFKRREPFFYCLEGI